MSLQTRITALAQAIGADVKALLAALAGKAPAVHTHSATSITNAPAGGVTATNMQAAINELDAEKLPKAATEYGNGSGNMNDAPVGSISAYWSVTGAGTNYPATSFTTAWWNVLTFGEPSRKTQIAQQAFATRAGQLWFRHLHDASWYGWYRLPFTTAETGYIVSDGGALGYGAASTGSATQMLSKGYELTLHKPCGRITTHNETLAAGASVTFTFYNTYFGAYDALCLTPLWDGVSGNYRVECTHIGIGGAAIRITNISGAARSDAVQFNFAVIKGGA